MTYSLNQDFYWIRKGEGISVTSVLPDQNEIFHFNGEAAKILEQWFSDKNAKIDQALIPSEIPEEDWKAFVDFLVEKKILLSK